MREGVILNLQLSDFYTLKATHNTVVPDKLPRDVGDCEFVFLVTEARSCGFFLVTRSRGTVPLCETSIDIF
jgi:hypothetical protein